MVRSLVAVLVGFFLIGALASGGEVLVRQLVPSAYDPAGRMTSLPLLALTQAYVALFAITGCYVCARLAPHHPLRHAMILGVLGLLFNLYGSYVRWTDVPAWFHAVGLGLTLPYAYIGGWLREREVARQAAIVGAAAM